MTINDSFDYKTHKVMKPGIEHCSKSLLVKQTEKNFIQCKMKFFVQVGVHKSLDQCFDSGKSIPKWISKEGM
jgi:hypothetical protein